MKVSIQDDELYPFYVIFENIDIWKTNIVDLTDEEYNYCRKAQEDFEEFQNFLEEKYEQSESRNRH